MRGFQEYASTQIETAHPGELITLLFQHVVRRLDLAEEALQRSAPMEYTAHLIRVREIYSELLAALDPETAPEIVTNLKRLYFWCIRETNRAGVSKDPQVLEGIRKVTVTLLEGWTEAVEAAR